MCVSKVKLYKSFNWSNKEVYKFKLGYKRHGIHKSKPEFDLLDAINIKKY